MATKSRKEYYVRNKEHILGKVKMWAKNHPDKVRVAKKKWAEKHPQDWKSYYAKNKVNLKQNVKKWRDKNLEKVKSGQKKWNAENPEKVKAKHKRWKSNNKQKVNHSNRVRSYRIRSLAKSKSSHSLREWEEIKRFFNHCCAGCGMQEPFTDQYYQFLTEDHIIPLSKGGSNDIGNIQPLCQRCNSRKSTKVLKSK